VGAGRREAPERRLVKFKSKLRCISLKSGNRK